MIVIFLLCVCFASRLEPTQATQLLLIALSRHGDRSPVHRPPGVLSETANWTIGYGQLTALGAQQHVNLGKFIRTAYSDFLPRTYHKDEAFFVSTAMERTLMSANSFVAGLYANENKSYIPPPIYSVPLDQDHLLKMSSNCPEYLRRYKGVISSTITDFMVNTYSKTIQLLLKEHESWRPLDTSPASVVRVAWNICDAVLIWWTHLLEPRPAWLSGEVARHCAHLLDFKQRVRFSTAQLTQFRGGPLAAHLVRLLRLRANHETGANQMQPLLVRGPYDSREVTSQQRLFAYFAHDSTLAAVMSHLGIHNGLAPPMASCLLVELHQLPISAKWNEAFYARFRYRNTTNLTDPRAWWSLWPPACGKLKDAAEMDYMCPLSRLEKGLAGTYVTNPDEDCFPGVTPESTPSDDRSQCYYPHLILLMVFQFSAVLYLWNRLGRNQWNFFILVH